MKNREQRAESRELRTKLRARVKLTVLLLRLSLLSALCSLLCNCTPDPAPTLNFQERGVVDSLYKLQLDSLKIVLDSLCEVRHDSAVQFKVDSMMQERQSEIDRYLERIRNSQ